MIDEIRIKKDGTLIGMPLPNLSPKKSNIDILFDGMLEQVNRLLQYPDWLPIQRCQLSFYSENLRSLSRHFQSFRIRDYQKSKFSADLTLSVLVSSILEYKFARSRADFLYTSKTLEDLNLVGDRLAVQVALIYKATDEDLWNDQDFDFPFQFYFDKKKFQEQLKEEVFVGFQEEASDLLHQLASITVKKLRVISIVGMAGLGKTTLAKRLYNDPYVASYFYLRAWVTCSQVYQKRDLLLTILRSVSEITDQIRSMNDNMLAHVLYCALKGQRYLIIVDDIWSSEAWDDSSRSFPDDNNGSKIMLTTRLKDVALHAQSDGNPLCLRFLTEDESFDLLRRKVFITGNFFSDLSLIGKSITRKCHGLPLAIVVIAGLLKNNFEVDWWMKVAESVRSYIITDENQYMDTLALSYIHLPQHLKPCFLSFGAFPEDHDIPVHKLIWLWIAEGFIPQDGSKRSLEDVAEDYLMDLTRRSLVVVGKRGPNGAMKTCRIHDLLRDLGLRKAEEENISPNIYKYNKHILVTKFHDALCFTNHSTKSQLFLCTNVLKIPANCVCAAAEVSQPICRDVSVIWDMSNSIRALDMSSIELFVFPSALLQLVHLRYLELRFRSGNPPDSISQLKELQTLIISSKMNMVVPKNMWKMISLKHL